MPSNFPASDDVFDVPSDPANTPLGSAGDGTRIHGSEHHRDIGDAVEAMQAQQTLLAHSHDGATFRHGSKLVQANTHQSADTDSGAASLHHTIGSGANQGAAGDHTHDIVAAYPIGAYFFSIDSTTPGAGGLGFPGTWEAMGQRFLVAQDGGTFIAGAQAGVNTHSHTNSSTSSASAHTHTFADTGTSGAHTHTNTVNSAGASHVHALSSAGLGVRSMKSGSAQTIASASHTHTSSSSNPTHTHSASSTDSGADHTHTVSSSGSSGGHSHTASSAGSSSNLPPYLVVYVFRRTA